MLLRNFSDFSLLRSTAPASKIPKVAKELGYEAVALTDYASISGVIQFMASADKCGIKPIAGCQFYCNKEQSEYITVLAKNYQGWLELIQATNRANAPENIIGLKDTIHKPCLPIEELGSLKNCFVYTGYVGSGLFNALFENPHEAYLGQTKHEVAQFLHPDWSKRAITYMDRCVEIFGKDNFRLAKDICSNLPAAQISNAVVSQLAQTRGLKLISVNDTHFLKKENSRTHRILLCTRFKTNISKLDEMLKKTNEDYVHRFLTSMNFYMPSKTDWEAQLSSAERENIEEMQAACDHYSLSRPPTVPEFKDEHIGNRDQAEYLKHLCRQGWLQKIDKVIPKDQLPKYIERIKMELDVVIPTGILPSYFLIVQEYCNWARSVGMKIGERGSGAGCLISYLLGITNLDPVKYDLVFSRFYNTGRNTANRVSLPDIDVDFPKYRREEVIEHIKQRYGDDKVAHMLTFNTLKGRGALKEVLSAYNKCTFETMNLVTKNIPQEADISDQLQLMKDAGRQGSAILWTLENTKDLNDWCQLTEDEELDGPYALEFKQALELEGCKKSPGKHASGIVLSTDDIYTTCPMVYDKQDKQLIAGLEMGDLENVLGLPKLDVLGSLSLDKIQKVEEVINDGVGIILED